MSEARVVRVPETFAEQNQIVLPAHTNNHGTAFGGQVVAWIDICASVSARRFARRPVVTASIDELHFLRAVRLGMILVLRSMVNRAWGSSMEVGVRIDTEDSATGETQHCCSAYLTFVALDDEGRPTPVPTLDCTGNADERRRAEEADARRNHRLFMRKERSKVRS